MTKQEGSALTEVLGTVAEGLHRDTGAPVVIILCMGRVKGGTVLAACYGPRGPAEMATALRYAADNTEDADSIHLKCAGDGAKA